MDEEEKTRYIRDLTDKGLLVEAGFFGLRQAAIPANASEGQVNDMRVAFFAGALYLFGSMVRMFDTEDEQPTSDDMARMGLINAELADFDKWFQEHHGDKKGGHA